MEGLDILAEVTVVFTGVNGVSVGFPQAGLGLHPSCCSALNSEALMEDLQHFTTEELVGT